MTARLRLLGAGAAVASLMAVLAGCGLAGTESSSEVVLHWYTGPDRANVDALAKSCTAEASGQYSISVESLPEDQSQRRAFLLKRLLGKDDSMDIISLDDAFTAEFAKAQVLAPVPEHLTDTFTEDAFDAAVDSASYGDNLVAVPWWLDPVMLWYRPSAAERAGLDMDGELTWEELFDGARQISSHVEIDDDRGEGIEPLVQTLIAQSGGESISGVERSASVGFKGEPGQNTASVLRQYNNKNLGQGPTREAIENFAGPSGAFLMAPASAISDPAFASISADVDWAPMPVMDEDESAWLSGYHLAVPLYAQHSKASFDAIECMTSTEAMTKMMTTSGHSPASEAAYDEAGGDYPWADVTRKAVDSGKTAPSTPYWHLIHDAIEETWMPLSDVTSSTPGTSQRRIESLLAGDKP